MPPPPYTSYKKDIKGKCHTELISASDQFDDESSSFKDSKPWNIHLIGKPLKRVQGDRKIFAKQVIGQATSDRRAFTLAEVLIALVVIGIVAAITVPVIMEDVRTKSDVQRLKKSYSAISNAYKRILVEEGKPDEWGMLGMFDQETHEILAKKFLPYLSVSKNCIGMNDVNVVKYCSKKCNPTTRACLVTNDGTLLKFRTYYNDCRGTYGSIKNVCGTINVDVNGDGAPNLLGKDDFVLYYTKDEIIPVGTPNDSLSFNTHCTKTKKLGESIGDFVNGMGCAAWVIYNENKDYLKCSDLNWGGKTKCK